MHRPRLAFIALLLAAPSALGGVIALVQQPAKAEVTWSPCKDVKDAQCAFIKVPVDNARPDGVTIDLRLGRVPAVDPNHKRGVLLLIPGGPGVGLAETFGSDREGMHVEELSRLYDIVSFDPRGIGESNPIRCSPDLVPKPIAPFDRAPTQAEWEAIGRANAAFVKSCFELTGALMGRLSSMDTAGDIERIRLALTANDGLLAYSVSYGTGYAGAYLERYGDHVKALVLDGVYDHSTEMRTDLTRHILSVQDGFDRFGRWCARDPSCALHGEDVGTVFDAVIAKAPAVRTIVPQLMVLGRDPKMGWSTLALMLAQVRDGDAKTLEALTGAASIASTAEDPAFKAGKEGLLRGVQCSDVGAQNDYAGLLVAYKALEPKAPRFAWKFWDGTPQAHGTYGAGDCAGWPLDATNPPHRLKLTGSYPNVLVANSTHDSSTPLINALSVWMQIPDARLLISDVDGHQSLMWSRCAYETAVRFVRDPAAIELTTICAN
jgi:pimeloyl-ACP methyl ester carboxylesterase